MSGYCLGTIRTVRVFINEIADTKGMDGCVPAKVTPEDIAKVLIKYADQHPEHLYEPPAQQSGVVLIEAYCKSN